MDWAKITILIMILIKLGIHLANFGKEQKRTIGWVELLAIGISITLYYYAGIMDVFK